MGWLRAASFRDLKEGGVIGVDVAGKPVALYLLNGTIYATHNICTHQFAFLLSSAAARLAAARRSICAARASMAAS